MSENKVSKGNVMCARCSTVVKKTGYRQKYCKICSDIIHLNQIKARNKDKYVPKCIIINCLICNTSFIRTSPTQKYCKNCKIIGRRIFESKYRINNRDKIKEHNKRFKNTERGKIIIQRCNRNRWAAIHQTKHNFTIDEWLIKLANTNGICPICMENVGVEFLTMDHIIPVSKAPRGFIYTIKDVQPLCRSCNSKKGNRGED